MPKSSTKIDPEILWPDLYKKAQYCLDQDEVIQSLFLATYGINPVSFGGLLSSALAFGAPPKFDIVVVTNKSIKILEQATIPLTAPNSTFGSKCIGTFPRNIRLEPLKKSFALYYKCVIGGKDYWVGRGYVRALEIADSFLSE